MTTKREIKEWMKNNVEDNLHREGNVNCKQLAEDAACNGFDKPEWLDDETHDVWEAAVEIAYWYEVAEGNCI